MKHLGDITKINWFEVEPVDCVTGGRGGGTDVERGVREND